MDTPVTMILSARFGIDVESLLVSFPQLEIETKRLLKTRTKYRIQGKGDMILIFLEKLKSLSFSDADISISDIHFSSVDQAIEYLTVLAAKESLEREYAEMEIEREDAVKEAIERVERARMEIKEREALAFEARERAEKAIREVEKREADLIEAKKRAEEAMMEAEKRQACLSEARERRMEARKLSEERKAAWQEDVVFHLQEPGSSIIRSSTNSMFDLVKSNDTTAVPVKTISPEAVDMPETEVNPKDDVNAAVFSPAKVKAGSRMLVQVFLYLDEEGDEVVSKAKEADEEAERRGYAPLDFPLARKEAVTVQLAFEDIDYLETKSVIWKGRMRKMDFIVKVPKDAPESFFGEVTVSAQGLPLGSMVFKTAAVKYKEPLLHADVTAIDYQRIFVSYAHADEDKIKYLIEGYRSLGRTVDFFYDRMSLRPGDEYPDQILDYIDHADLFVLCWSENAANSQWVGIEKKRALDRYQRESGSRLRLYPISIKPSADLPNDMRDRFHFGVVN